MLVGFYGETPLGTFAIPHIEHNRGQTPSLPYRIHYCCSLRDSSRMPGFEALFKSDGFSPRTNTYSKEKAETSSRHFARCRTPLASLPNVAMRA